MRGQIATILQHLADIVEILVNSRDFAAQIVHNEIHGKCAVLHAAGLAGVVGDEALQHVSLLLDALQRLHVVVLHLCETRVGEWRFSIWGGDCSRPNCH